MNRIFVICLVLWAVAGCGGGGKGDSNPPQPPTPQAVVAMLPAAAVVNSGETFSRTIDARNLGKASYAAFDLIYDPNVLEYVSASEGGFFKQDGHASTSFQANLVGGVPGRVAVGGTRLGQVDGVSGTGTIATLTFKAVGSGQSALAFKDPRGLRNRDNQPVTVDRWEDGIVTVQ